MKNIFSEQKWEKLVSLWQKGMSEKNEQLDYENPEVKKLIYDQFRIRCAIKTFTYKEHNINSGWQKIKQKTKIVQRKRKIRHLQKYAAIAILLLTLVVGGKWLFSLRDLVTKYPAEAIQIGTSKAKLFLPNGRCLELRDSNKNIVIEEFGAKMTHDSLTGKLYYHSNETNEQDISGFNVLNVPKGGEYSFILPDGSIVWLNSESSLRFPVKFSTERREVYLMGEAFFKVAKNEKIPFYVNIGENNIKVLGTQFNVSAYTNDHFWNTTLVEGSIVINGNILLQPSQQYVVDLISREGELKTVESEFYTSWIDGKFYFQGFTFEEIVNRLERWYDFKMFYQNEEIKQMRFTGTINKHRPLEEMLKFLEKTTNIKFQIQGKTITAKKIYERE